MYAYGRIVCQRYTLCVTDTGPHGNTTLQQSFWLQKATLQMCSSLNLDFYIHLVCPDRLCSEAREEGVERWRQSRSPFVFLHTRCAQLRSLAVKTHSLPLGLMWWRGGVFSYKLTASLTDSGAVHAVTYIQVETEIHSMLPHLPDNKRGFSLKLPYCSSLTSVKNARCDIQYNAFLYLS